MTAGILPTSTQKYKAAELAAYLLTEDFSKKLEVLISMAVKNMSFKQQLNGSRERTHLYIQGEKKKERKI